MVRDVDLTGSNLSFTSCQICDPETGEVIEEEG